MCIQFTLLENHSCCFIDLYPGIKAIIIIAQVTILCKHISMHALSILMLAFYVVLLHSTHRTTTTTTTTGGQSLQIQILVDFNLTR